MGSSVKWGAASSACAGRSRKLRSAIDPFRVGLDHFALGCPDEAELQRVAAALEEAGVWNTGVKELPELGAKYVAFKDPDGIKLELWLGQYGLEQVGRASGAGSPAST